MLPFDAVPEMLGYWRLARYLKTFKGGYIVGTTLRLTGGLAPFLHQQLTPIS